MVVTNPQKYEVRYNIQEKVVKRDIILMSRKVAREEKFGRDRLEADCRVIVVENSLLGRLEEN